MGSQRFGHNLVTEQQQQRPPLAITLVNLECEFSEMFVVVQSLSCVWLFATPWTTACQASLSLTISQSLLKLMSFESVMPSNHLVLCQSLLLLPSIFPSIRVFSNESTLEMFRGLCQCVRSISWLLLVLGGPQLVDWLPGYVFLGYDLWDSFGHGV